ncbi:hypothetical protein CRUP_033099 [Coryphaenoides rupestris]|nr:hypothetical protein CRUP_033099 [Coryphaenoides rupestris]
MATKSITDMQLEDVLHEFDAVVQELRSPSRSSGSSCGHRHLLLLQEGRRCSRSTGDSGVEDSDYTKLGDTGDLQSFIDSLDQELAERERKPKEGRRRASERGVPGAPEVVEGGGGDEVATIQVEDERRVRLSRSMRRLCI